MRPRWFKRKLLSFSLYAMIVAKKVKKYEKEIPICRVSGFIHDRGFLRSFALFLP